MSDYKSDAKSSRSGKMKSMGCYAEGGTVSSRLSDARKDVADAMGMEPDDNVRWRSAADRGPAKMWPDNGRGEVDKRLKSKE